MELRNNDDYDYANYLINNGLLEKRENMIWFAKYLINEYSVIKNVNFDFSFFTNLDVIQEKLKNKKFSLRRILSKINILGEYKPNNIFLNKHAINIYTGGKILPKNKTLEQLLFTCFHEMSHATTRDLINSETRNMIQLGNLSLYSKKNYEISKENCIIKLIGENNYYNLHDCWLIECDADIIGGEILLDIMEENFADTEIIKRIKQYTVKEIRRAKLSLYNPMRKQLLDAEDRIIKSYPELLKNKFLMVEYNEDGSKKNLIQLLEIRKGIQHDLNSIPDASYGVDYLLKNKWESKKKLALNKNDELFGELSYRIIENLEDEELSSVLLNLTEDERQLIMNCIKEKEVELSDAINFITDNNSNIETNAEIDVKTHLSNKLSNCLRLKKMVEFKYKKM